MTLAHPIRSFILFKGGRAHYIIESKVQWKPFWLATQQYPQNDWLGGNFLYTMAYTHGPIVSALNARLEIRGQWSSAPKFGYTDQVSAAWCSGIGSLMSLDAPGLHASSNVREPISLHQAVLVKN